MFWFFVAAAAVCAVLRIAKPALLSRKSRRVELFSLDMKKQMDADEDYAGPNDKL